MEVSISPLQDLRVDSSGCLTVLESIRHLEPQPVHCNSCNCPFSTRQGVTPSALLRLGRVQGGQGSRCLWVRLRMSRCTRRVLGLMAGGQHRPCLNLASLSLTLSGAISALGRHWQCVPESRWTKLMRMTHWRLPDTDGVTRPMPAVNSRAAVQPACNRFGHPFLSRYRNLYL